MECFVIPAPFLTPDICIGRLARFGRRVYFVQTLEARINCIGLSDGSRVRLEVFLTAFDKPLKYLIEQDPASFVSFALGRPVRVLEPVSSLLPGRRRQVDESYRVETPEGPWIWHLEFHRRRQKVEALAHDVAEAQLRFARREGLPVLSLVLDLYGKRDAPLLEARTLAYGCSGLGESSKSVYYRLNLRAIEGASFLATAPPMVWPLIPLTRDGRKPEVIRMACEAIEQRQDLTETQRLNYGAILYTVAQAEGADTHWLRTLYSEETLMRSTFYNRVVRESRLSGRQAGRQEGRQEGLQEGRLRQLQTLMGLPESSDAELQSLSPATLQQRIDTLQKAILERLR